MDNESAGFVGEVVTLRVREAEIKLFKFTINLKIVPIRSIQINNSP